MCWIERVEFDWPNTVHSVSMLKESETVISHSVRYQYLAVLIGVFVLFLFCSEILFALFFPTVSKFAFCFHKSVDFGFVSFVFVMQFNVQRIF